MPGERCSGQSGSQGAARRRFSTSHGFGSNASSPSTSSATLVKPITPTVLKNAKGESP